MGIYVISDTHFYHARMIIYENRPFNSAEEMNAEMIKRWNNKVSNKDTIFHLGDFAFANKDKTREIVQQLNGKKILIMGDHDQSRSVRWFMDCGFDEVYRYPIVYQKYFILSHEPIPYLKAPFINIYGHAHGSPNYTTFTKSSACVCVERWNYSPINWNTIMINLERLQRKMEQALTSYEPIEVVEK